MCKTFDGDANQKPLDHVHNHPHEKLFVILI